ncbi:LamG-like jellyroll fold domain-containing protein [Catellatospora paridis]|uniref:LamG-like jellyroll fold domain-containing protein n=1 Tax=Catellatospora paridis TaxID=1617086 RepID=UPI0012D404F9|nr:LamG-like jellyroll fold domain-containing protein [Catellatospora paridis]
MVAGLGAYVDASPAVAATVCAEQASSEKAALALAASCDSPVAVDATRTEYTQVLALPGGGLRLEASVVPQRARAGGAWVDIDLGLRRGGDGRWRPAVSVADVAFSAGGSGPLVTLTRGGRSMSLTWPAGALPVPTVSGEAVTYRNVFANVDLVVRATRTGFTHVLVIKSAAAAADPALRRIRFGLGGDAEIVRGRDGSLSAVADGVVLAAAEPAVMWDSRTAAAAARTAQPKTSVAGSRSSAAAAGDAARVAKVAAQVSGRELVLSPDTALLDSPDAVFPLYVDPAWSAPKSKWAYATDNNSSNTDYSVARVGLNPDTGALYRSFFEFPTTANNVSLKGKHIESARVEMDLDHSWSCGDTVSSMYAAPAINATMKATWSKMTLGGFLDDAFGHANEAGGCSGNQQNMLMNYASAGVTSQVQAAANGSWNSITFGFTARAANGTGESTQDRWKRFDPAKAKLFVDFDTVPGAPLDPQVAGVSCPASGVVTVGTLSPTLSVIFADGDPTDSLTGTFEWIEVPAGGISTVTDTSPARLAAPPQKTGVTPNTRATSAAVTVVRDSTYAFRARATDRAPYTLTGPWSAWCQFVVDTTVPPATAQVLTLPSGPGMPGRLRFESTATDVVKFKYSWTGGALTEVAAQGGSPRWAEVEVTAQKFGRNVVDVWAVDSTLNEGKGTVEFTVGRASPPIARWGLEAYPGISQTHAMADQQPALAAQLLTPAQSQMTDISTFITDNHATDMSIDTDRGQGGSTESLQLAPLASGASEDTFAAPGGDTGGFRLGMQPGRSYRASAWIYVPGATGLNPVDGRGLRIAVYHKTGTYGFVSSPKASIVDSWQRLSVDFTVPANATEAFIRLYNGFRTGNPGKVVYWDNLSVTELTDQPLASVTDVTWPSDVRVLDAETASFNGTSSRASTATPVIDPTKSFSVAAWVKLGEQGQPLPTGNRIAVAQDGGLADSFVLGYSGNQRWAMWMHTSDTASAVETGVVYSPVPVETGVWTHLAGVYDAVTGKTTLYVNGRSPVSAGAQGLQPWPNRQRITLGRELWDGAAASFWSGQIADVQVFDRVLVPQDFTGQLATDPGSGGFDEPGFLTPVQVAGWDFSAAVPCYTADIIDTCEAPDSTAWGRWLALTRGSAVGAGHSAGGHGLWLDSEYFPEEGYSEATQERGRSAVKTGTSGDLTVWQDRAVLRTDQSFTISAWVDLADSDGYHTAVTQQGSTTSGFFLYYDVNVNRWAFAMHTCDGCPTSNWVGATSAAPPELGRWTHLTGVYDKAAGQLRLYVDGKLQGSAAWAGAWNATGPLTVGGGKGGGRWNGGIDEVRAFQGAMTDMQVRGMYNSFVETPPGTNTLTKGHDMVAGDYLRSDTGGYELVMQSDGNLVLGQAGQPLWDSSTWGNPGSWLSLQTDGNLVIYNSGDVPIWDTATWGSTGDRLVLRDDGDLVLLDADGQIVWRR